jgi:drug/metabolite transporter (DMT)-like permease
MSSRQRGLVSPFGPALILGRGIPHRKTGLTDLATGATGGRTAQASPAFGGWGAALLSVLIFSAAPPVNKITIMAGMNPSTVLLVRLYTAGALLLVSIAVSSPSALRIHRRGALLCCGAGFADGIAVASFNWSLTRISASIATMLFSVYPLLILLASTRRGTGLSARSVARLALGLVGIYLLVGPGGRPDGVGVLLVLVSMLCYCTYLLILHWFLGGYDVRSVIVYGVAGASTSTTIIWLAQGAEWHRPEVQSWLAVLFLAVVVTYLGQLLFIAAVRRIGSGEVALLSPLQTLFTIVWSVWFLNESLSSVQSIGAAAILAGMLMAVPRLRLRQWRVWWRP